MVSGDYTTLAPIYDRIGMADFAQALSPRLLNLAQRNDWMGRRILDVGSGTGAVSAWFAQNSYNVISVENDPAMLKQQRAKLGDHPSLRIVEADILELDKTNLYDPIDMAIALNVLNSVRNLRELEAVLAGLEHVLAANKFFIFDVHTIYGLTEHGQTADTIVHDDEDLVVFRTSSYDFERQINTNTYYIFQQQDGQWQRSQAQLTLRAFPVQGIATLLKRHHFDLVALIDPTLNAVDPATSNVSRVIFVVKKTVT